MAYLKSLASQTVIYGIPSILGRLINFLLVFLFTNEFDPSAFAAHPEFYAFSAIFLVILPHGMETALYNFCRKDVDPKSVFTAGFVSILVLGVLFFFMAWFNADAIASWMNYSGKGSYVKCFTAIIFFDVLSSLPLALLRHQERASFFAFVKMLSVIITVLLNLFFFVWLKDLPDNWSIMGFSKSLIQSKGIGLVFIANTIASAMVLFFLVPTILKNLGKWNAALWKSMLSYSWPLIIVGLAGIINETLDRAVLDKLLISDNPKYEIGVYGAFYKLSIIITMFIQAFRYAAEPFFFSRSKEKDNKKVYANVMDYFVLITMSIFLLTVMFLDEIAPFAIRNAEYFKHPDGLRVVPILLMANVFLGINYNLSIWYKLMERTKLAALIAASSAVFSIIALIMFVPKYGFYAAAWITLSAYFMLCLLNYFVGQKYYKINYNTSYVSVLIISGLGLWLLFNSQFEIEQLSLFVRVVIVASFFVAGLVLKSRYKLS